MRPLDPANWPLTKPATVKSVTARLVEIRRGLDRDKDTTTRVGLMVNRADIEELLTALTQMHQARARRSSVTPKA
jgi:hypothetical protein